MALTLVSLGSKNGVFPVQLSTRITLDNKYPRGGWSLSSAIGSNPGQVMLIISKNGKGLTLAYNAASNKMLVFERLLNTQTREILEGAVIRASQVTGTTGRYWTAPWTCTVTGFGVKQTATSSATITTQGRLQLGYWKSAGSTRLAKATATFIVNKKPGTDKAASFTAFTVKKNDMLDVRISRQGKGAAKAGQGVPWIEYRTGAAACEVKASATLASVQVDILLLKQTRS